MAKKKDFDNIVEESFNEGYQSEPDRSPVPQKEEPVEKPAVTESENLSEDELLLRQILSGDRATIGELCASTKRSTYYFTLLELACIDIMAHEEGIKKNDIITTALDRYLKEEYGAKYEELKTAAQERVVTMEVKDLKQKIKVQAKASRTRK